MATTKNDLVEKMLHEFSLLSNAPEKFLSAQKNAARKFTNITKKVYDFAKSSETQESSEQALPELIVANFDDEQVWQELELQNTSIISHLIEKVSSSIARQKRLSFQIDGPEQNETDLPRKAAKKLVNKNETTFAESSSDFSSASDSNEIAESSDNDSDVELKHIKSRLKYDDEAADSDDDDIDFDFDDTKKDGDSDHGEQDSTDEDSQFESKRKKSKKSTLSRSSEVDDKFFKLSEMEAFLDQEDAKEEKQQMRLEKGIDASFSGDEVDYFKSLDSDDDEVMGKTTRELRYKDFFKAPDMKKGDTFTKNSGEFGDDSWQASSTDDDEARANDEDKGKRVRFSTADHSTEPEEAAKRQPLLSGSDSEGEDVSDILGAKTEKKSTFEKRQENLKKKIADMESASLVEKSWQMMGETSAQARPENSLLQEHLQFDHMTRLPPVITEETTKTLEDIVRQRIKDKAWDDVERTIKPQEDPFEYKKRIVLDQEKSKQSLGEIYEKEYLKQHQAEKEERVDPDHSDIKKLMQSLFVKLDALSNFHYTPKLASAEVKIVSNLPSIAMEEVAPISVSEAKMLAPEEIKDKLKSELKGATEKTDTDRKRERRLKKTEKRQKIREKEKRQKLVDKLNPGLGNKYSKEKALKSLEQQSKTAKGVTVIKGDKHQKGSLTSSKAFFTQLQDEVSSHVQKKKSSGSKNEKKMKHSSSKLKL